MKTITIDEETKLVVSDEDFHAFSARKWRLDKDGYARTSIWIKERGRPISLYMHHMVLPAQKGFQVDHINENKLDNRRENLRYATHSENMTNRRKVRNTSGFRGIRKEGSTWTMRICKEKARKVIYGFKTPEDAARSYNELAKELHGDFAVLNKV